jgi:hypothetical protein
MALNRTLSTIPEVPAWAESNKKFLEEGSNFPGHKPLLQYEEILNLLDLHGHFDDKSLKDEGINKLFHRQRLLRWAREREKKEKKKKE